MQTFPKNENIGVFLSSKPNKQVKREIGHHSENGTLTICNIFTFMSKEVASTAVKLLIYCGQSSSQVH